MTKSIWILLIVLVLIALGWGGFVLLQKSELAGPDLSVAYPSQGQQHIEVGSPHPEFSSNPPSSGWHYGLTAKKKFYDEPVLDGYSIHNLEHGDVWIAYHPRIPDAGKKELKKFAFSKILISPREANDTDIALVAWERVDAFNLGGEPLPESRIRDFIKRYRNRGPEKIPPGAMEATFN